MPHFSAKRKVPGLLCFIWLGLFSILSCSSENVSKTQVQEISQQKMWSLTDTRNLRGLFAERGLLKNDSMASPGYILLYKRESTYLMNKQGEIVHEFYGENGGNNAYLLENGDLLRMEKDRSKEGGGYRWIRRYNWDSKKLWEFEFDGPDRFFHHDIAILPNGNILAIVCERRSFEEAVALGRNPKKLSRDGIWPDMIIEIMPEDKGGQIVWEWRSWDHIVQSTDPTLPNFGKSSDFPHLIDINIAGAQLNSTNPYPELYHFNAVFYNEALDQIAISSPKLSEIFIVDHSTPKDEVKGSTGGRSGRGGDLLYRWGNPQNYGRGGPSDRQLYGGHDVRWIPSGFPGGGNLIVFVNDIPGRSINTMKSPKIAINNSDANDPQISLAEIGNYSAIFEIELPYAEKGTYELTENSIFGPDKPVWTFIAQDTFSFYSAVISGAERLKNGNTIINQGTLGRIMEVNSDGQILWEYWNPYNSSIRLLENIKATYPFSLFRVIHILPDHPALDKKELLPMVPQPEVFDLSQYDHEELEDK